MNAAAWDFMKFMTEADQQVTWHTGTGYFPVLASLQDSPPAELATFWDENPNFVTAIEQLATTNTRTPTVRRTTRCWVAGPDRSRRFAASSSRPTRSARRRMRRYRKR